MRRWKRQQGGNLTCTVDFPDGRSRRVIIKNSTVAGACLVFPEAEDFPAYLTITFKERNQEIVRTCQVMWTEGREVGVKYTA